MYICLGTKYDDADVLGSVGDTISTAVSSGALASAMSSYAADAGVPSLSSVSLDPTAMSFDTKTPTSVPTSGPTPVPTPGPTVSPFPTTMDIIFAAVGVVVLAGCCCGVICVMMRRSNKNNKPQQAAPPLEAATFIVTAVFVNPQEIELGSPPSNTTAAPPSKEAEAYFF